MKVLFVSGGNSSSGISSLVRAQGDSLANLGLSIDYFPIVGKGLKGYLANVKPLRDKIRSEKYDLVHAHFSFCGFVAALAGAQPLVVSLMGWNVRKPLLRLMIKLINRMFWRACIVKSAEMQNFLKIRDLILLPNGVDLELFKPMDKREARSYLGWEEGVTHILFAANPARPIKDYPLARQAFAMFSKSIRAELHALRGVNHLEMPYHYNAADVVLLTSKAEGSPNVIKEAMACNCRIVSTDVGDVRERFANSPACYICGHDPEDICSCLQQALEFKEPVNTREAVLGLDSRLIAGKLLSIYHKVIEKNRKGLKS